MQHFLLGRWNPNRAIILVGVSMRRYGVWGFSLSLGDDMYVIDAAGLAQPWFGAESLVVGEWVEREAEMRV